MEYSLLYEFTKDSEDYSLGIECGILAGQMKAQINIIEGTIHSKSKAQILKMAEAYWYCPMFSFINDDWLNVRLELLSKPEFKG